MEVAMERGQTGRKDHTPRVRTLSDLSKRNTVHVKLFLENVGKEFEALRALDEREKEQGRAVPRSTNGMQVLTNAENVGLKLLWAQLYDSDFHLFDAYREPWKKEGLCITLVYCHNKRIEWDKNFRLPNTAVVPVKNLLRSVWRYAHVWENPDMSTSIVLLSRWATPHLKKPALALGVMMEKLRITKI